MKALTICQPYAELIMNGSKRVENRDWPTRYRGPLIIHAGKSRSWLDESISQPGYDHESGLKIADLTFGAIVGIVDLVACVHVDQIPDDMAWMRTHEHTHGTWCWVLENVRRINPIPYRGAQGLFDIPEEVLKAGS